MRHPANMYSRTNLKVEDFEFSRPKVCKEFNRDLKRDSVGMPTKPNSFCDFAFVHITVGLSYSLEHFRMSLNVQRIGLIKSA